MDGIAAGVCGVVAVALVGGVLVLVLAGVLLVEAAVDGVVLLGVVVFLLAALCFALTTGFAGTGGVVVSVVVLSVGSVLGVLC